MPLITSSDPFIGREGELDRLIAAFDSALDGTGGLAMLVGEPGIGKTRLMEEIAVVAQGRDAVVTQGASYEGGTAPPYWPWIQVIRSFLIKPSKPTLAALRKCGAVISEIVPEINEVLPELEVAETIDPGQARFRLFDSVTSFLTEIAAEQTMVIVLDDLHWADRSTLDLLEFVAHDVSSSSILLIGSYRDVELTRHHPLSESMAALARIRGFQRILLRGLEGDDVGHLVNAVTGSEVPTALKNEIYDRTEGNPFFVAELARDMSHEIADSGWDDHGSFRIPDSIREAIGHRLNRLSDECNQGFTTAAIIGREFSLELMRRLLPNFSEEQFLGVLDEALSAGVIEEIPDVVGRCRFTHMLIQETLSAEYSSARRAGVHGDIGKALESMYADDVGAHADELVHHFAEAEPWPGGPKLVQYSLMAGEMALATYAWEDALGHFERGLVAKEGHVIDADKAALLFGLGRSQAATFERYRLHEAAITVRPAFDYYVAAEDVPSALAIAEFPFVSLHESGGRVSMLAEALKLVPSDSHQMGRLLESYGAALNLESGSYEPAIKALSQALTIAQHENDRPLEIAVLNNMAFTHMINFNSRKAHELSLRAIELGRGVEHIHRGDWLAAAALIAMGELEDAQPHAAASLAMAQERGGHFSLAQGFLVNEAIAHLQGDWEAARDFSDRGLAVEQMDARLLSNRSALEYELCDYDQGDVYLERLIQTMHLTPTGPTLEHSITVQAIGLAAHITGETRYFDIADKAAKTILSSSASSTFYHQVARTGLALIAIERADLAAVAEQYEAIKSRRIALSVLNLMCDHRLLGLLAQTLRRFNDAIAHFESSLNFCRKAGALPELAWTSFDYSGALLQRGEHGDQSFAMSLVENALSISTELGMRALADRAATLREKIRQLPEKTPAFPAGLTPREVEVLRHLASGNSNAEIAGELVLSVRTVERHISNIYGKTGSAGRANATAFAFTNGLMSDHITTA